MKLTNEFITQHIANIQAQLDTCAQRGQAYQVKWHDIKLIVEIIKTLQERLEQAHAFNNDIVEREAATCPEDVSFDEYIKTLKTALLPFALIREVKSEPREAVLARNGHMVLNRDLERAAKLVLGEESKQ